MITALLKKDYVATKKKELKDNFNYIIKTKDVENYTGEELSNAFPNEIKMVPIFPNSNDVELEQYYSLDVDAPYDQIFLDYLSRKEEVEAAYIKPPEGIPD